MTQLTDWLASIDSVSGIAPVAVTINSVTYEGARYSDSNFNNTTRLYLLGALPACYKRSTKTAFVVDGADWYIATYMERALLATLKPEQRQYHVCGEHFMLCKWNAPQSIDQYNYYRGEWRPYNRVVVFDRSAELNLDHMESDDLMAFWKRHHTRSRHMATGLFPTRPAGYVRIARDLANYASNKAAAMQCRSRGHIDTAIGYESICNRIYDGLPAFARW